MKDQKPHTLDSLARDFDLTPRMARYHIEKLLPEHHRAGRGKLGVYGPDTWNCFAFIRKARDEFKLTTDQIREVLGKLSQEQIDRVVSGEEEVAIVTAPAGEAELPKSATARFYPRKEWTPEAESGSASGEEWHTLYESARLRIECRGELTAEQREEVRLAAKLIKRVLDAGE